ncbi:hypothetical protein RJ035_007720, partial [Blastomyces gilchristii]
MRIAGHWLDNVVYGRYASEDGFSQGDEVVDPGRRLIDERSRTMAARPMMTKDL